MNPRRTLIAFLALAGTLRAVDKVPDYDVTDSYTTSPTMLARVGIDGQVREVWTGMDPARRRHVPLFLETSIFGSVRKDGAWLDLRTLRYSRAGTRPGVVHLRSEDGPRHDRGHLPQERGNGPPSSCGTPFPRPWTSA